MCGNVAAGDLIDLGNHPEIYADGVGDVWVQDAMAHILFFRWNRHCGVLRRVIAMELIRPEATINGIITDAVKARRTALIYQ